MDTNIYDVSEAVTLYVLRRKEKCGGKLDKATTCFYEKNELIPRSIY
jgi:hypothetical protein